MRGRLNATALAKDGLTETEEALRIDFIEFLVDRRGYPVANIDVESVVLKRIGNAGRNSLRADVLIYDVPRATIHDKPVAERLKHTLLIAEIKRDSRAQSKAVEFQLEPALKLAPRMDTVGVYWDDENRVLLSKSLKEGGVQVSRTSVAKLPQWGQEMSGSAITYDRLSDPKNLLRTLNSIADVLRSRGVENKKTRYTETVKLLLARYTDERNASDAPDAPLAMQVHAKDPDFRNRIDGIYRQSAKRYSKAKTLFQPNRESSLGDDTLKLLVERIQGFRLSAAKNETMQQVFMSFVPAVFKKELSQYFTPLTLVDTIVEMVGIKRNDKVVDPAMGTADFLASAMSARQGDDDITQRIFGIDRDPDAFELAVVNMILNKDGQSGLQLEDSIANPKRWAEEMDVALCNPPFGSKTTERRPDILKEYDLGHAWEDRDGVPTRTSKVLDSQQLGLLFVERCHKLLDEGGRLGIILPEGYLSGAKYLYFRKWLLDKFIVRALAELPRRIFVKSDADLRSNILILEKKFADRPEHNYKIYSSMARKVGYKLTGDFSPTYRRDPETGMVLHDETNTALFDSDFARILEEYKDFSEHTDRQWNGAHVSDVREHPQLDLKPRRLVTRAIQLQRELGNDADSVRLGDIADVVETTIQVGSEDNRSKLFRPVEGGSIRAVEGIVSPGTAERGWHLAERKASASYPIQKNDIVVGLVRPERRNVGIVLDAEDNLVAVKDGVAVIRIKADNHYSQEWLFAALRREETRIQLWTVAGGTSYGKLSLEQIRDVQLRASQDEVQETTENVQKWIELQSTVREQWKMIGSDEDRRPILNSPLIGLIDGVSESDEDE